MRIRNYVMVVIVKGKMEKINIEMKIEDIVITHIMADVIYNINGKKYKQTMELTPFKEREEVK